MKFTLGDIAKAASGKIISGGTGLPCEGISIDTRKIERDNLFVAIRGAHFDGHDFLDGALSSGAAAVVVRRGVPIPRGSCSVEVDDTEQALGDIAAWWRKQFNVPCVAITGSNGKSTTKEMASAVASTLGPVLKTEGNFNNLIGLPLTIFRWNEDHKVAIIEMGMNAPGEIKRLTEIANPCIGIITNVTSAHLEKLHSVEAVAKAKGELFDAMDARGTAIINGEDRLVMEIASKRKGQKIVYGMQNDFDVQFLHMETAGLDSIDLKLSVFGKEYSAKLPVPGAHNVMNALAAISAGVALNIDPEEAIANLARFKPMGMRMECVQLSNGVRIVNDSYNANPGSMRAAFRTVGSAKRAGRFVAALGDMLELGESSAELHRQVGEAAAEMGVDRLYVTGEFASDVAAGAKSRGLGASNVTIFKEGSEKLGVLIEGELRAGDVLLVKGSRGMKMERVVEHLKSAIGMG